MNLSQTEKEKVAVLVLGGGRGTRLHPLTRNRSKPAVPFASRYRLVDIAISRCIHAGLRNLHVLTQYNSASLHQHINRTYRFDTFGKGGIQILPASQSYMQDDGQQWFLGSADAVRKTLSYYKQGNLRFAHYLIVPGDQIHELDLEDMLLRHLSTDADFTIAATPIAEDRLYKYGVVQSTVTGRVCNFLEKPAPDHPQLPAFRRRVSPRAQHLQADKPYWGSMGTYLIKAEVLHQVLHEDFPDFGGGVVPYAAKHHQMVLYPHLGFFEDIGVFESFFDVHIRLAESRLPINLYHPRTNIYTFRRELPPALFNGSACIDHSMVVEGSILGDGCALESSLIGVRSIIQRKARLRKVYLMGNDFYRCPKDLAGAVNRKDADIGIGAECQIENAIIDKNCRIGRACRIGLEPQNLADGDYNGYSIRSGIVIVPKGSVLPAGTVI